MLLLFFHKREDKFRHFLGTIRDFVINFNPLRPHFLGRLKTTIIYGTRGLDFTVVLINVKGHFNFDRRFVHGKGNLLASNEGISYVLFRHRTNTNVLPIRMGNGSRYHYRNGNYYLTNVLQSDSRDYFLLVLRNTLSFTLFCAGSVNQGVRRYPSGLYSADNSPSVSPAVASGDRATSNERVNHLFRNKTVLRRCVNLLILRLTKLHVRDVSHFFPAFRYRRRGNLSYPVRLFSRLYRLYFRLLPMNDF